MRTNLGARLREARGHLGLSARALDDKAGISHGHTALIESGRRENPSLETVRKLADALGVSLDSLVAPSLGTDAARAPGRSESDATTTRTDVARHD